jgi:hypothetical protein
LSVNSIEIIEAANRQIYRLIIYKWWDAGNEEVKCPTAFQTATTRAGPFLRRFIQKTKIILLELFEHYIRTKTMPMYLKMHIDKDHIIDALPRDRLNHYIR